MASEYLKWKYRDVKPDEPAVLTGRQKAANWWHYHKGMLLVFLLLAAALADIGRGMILSRREQPDYQIAYVASRALSDDTASALEKAFSSLGEDCNGDGRVKVRLNAYVEPEAAADSDRARYAYAAKTRLMADLEACDSYFFLLESPETFHLNYDILAGEDGSLADRSGFFACPAESCPVLRKNTEGADLSGLFLARRGFWGDRVCPNRDACDRLWSSLTEGAVL